MSITVLAHGVMLCHDQKVVCVISHADWFALKSMKNGKL